MTRRNLYIPDALWERIQRAAMEEGLRRGSPLSASEWVREACEKRLSGITCGTRVANRKQ